MPGAAAAPCELHVDVEAELLLEVEVVPGECLHLQYRLVSTIRLLHDADASDGQQKHFVRRSLKYDRGTRRFVEISQKASRVFSWLKVALSRLRHYAKQAPKHGR